MFWECCRGNFQNIDKSKGRCVTIVTYNTFNPDDVKTNKYIYNCFNFNGGVHDSGHKSIQNVLLNSKYLEEGQTHFTYLGQVMQLQLHNETKLWINRNCGSIGPNQCKKFQKLASPSLLACSTTALHPAPTSNCRWNLTGLTWEWTLMKFVSLS